METIAEFDAPPVPLTTERLILRPMVDEDFPWFILLHADPRVARFLADGKPRTADATRYWWDTTLRLYATEGIGHLAVVRESDGQLIGRCGLTYWELECPTPQARVRRLFWGRGSAPADLNVTLELEVGYVLAVQHWGNGYATEAARVMRDLAFARGTERIMLVLRPENTASILVASKLGAMPMPGKFRMGGTVFEVHTINRPKRARPS